MLERRPMSTLLEWLIPFSLQPLAARCTGARFVALAEVAIWPAANGEEVGHSGAHVAAARIRVRELRLRKGRPVPQIP